MKSSNHVIIFDKQYADYILHIFETNIFKSAMSNSNTLTRKQKAWKKKTAVLPADHKTFSNHEIKKNNDF